MDLTDHLNEEQRQAALHVDGPLLVNAGAGTGKTRVVTYRIARLISLGIPPEKILAVTFTNKAANEMSERIQALAHHPVLAVTFHSLGARILRESIHHLGYKSHFAIFDDEDTQKVLKECCQEKGLKEDKGFIKSIRGAISDAKSSMELPEDPIELEFYHLYQAKLKEYNALDFDDLLFLTVKLFKEHPEVLGHYQNKWQYILVDEYQDTNQAQYTILKLLCEKHQNVFAVGDPDQSIYSWRGANIGNILRFQEDYPDAKIIHLEHNYRSTSAILSAANAVIEHNTNRYEKNLWSKRGEGEKIGLYLCYSDREEVAFVLERLYQHHYRENIPLSECVIFYRTHFQSRVFEDALLKENIPYTIVGGISFYMRREIKDLLAFLRVANEGSDFLSFSRTINIPKRGIGPTTLAKIRSHVTGDLIEGCQRILEGKTELRLSKKQAEGLKGYLDLFFSLRNLITQEASISDLLEEILNQTGYLKLLKQDPDTAQEREENVNELLSKAAEWEEENAHLGLSDFLEELFLKSSPENTMDQDRLRLMTIHNGKGLEFRTTFVVGLEEEMFPHVNAMGNFEALEEERRLCYVAMTRAKDHLYLSAASSRYLWGSLRTMRPSRFLNEIPEEYLHKYHTTATSYEPEETQSGAFNPGDRVQHKDFGMGIVQKVYQTSLGLTYDVLFLEDESTRSLVAQYAKLKNG